MCTNSSKYGSDVKITGKKKVDYNVYILEMADEKISKIAKAGTFINMQAKGTTLRRAFAFMDANPKEHTFKILFSVVGVGTKELSLLEVGDTVSILAPLGNVFPMPKNGQSPVLIAGGSGIPPIHFLAKTLFQSGIKPTVIIGAKSENGLFLKDELSSISNIALATDDGSIGFRGNSVDLLRSILNEGKIQNPYIYSCGPKAMFRALKTFMLEQNIDGVFSFESIMGCGFGVCQGCALEKNSGQNDKKEYSLCCSDGPIFVFDEIKL